LVWELGQFVGSLDPPPGHALRPRGVGGLPWGHGSGEGERRTIGVSECPSTRAELWYPLEYPGSGCTSRFQIHFQVPRTESKFEPRPPN
jgi:hypothetical protein